MFLSQSVFQEFYTILVKFICKSEKRVKFSLGSNTMAAKKNCTYKKCIQVYYFVISNVKYLTTINQKCLAVANSFKKDKCITSIILSIFNCVLSPWFLHVSEEKKSFSRWLITFNRQLSSIFARMKTHCCIKSQQDCSLVKML